jgi:rhodanese-related sulfurtransferase
MVRLLFWFAYTKWCILSNFESIDAKTSIDLLENDDNVSLLDVRTIPEYKEGHLRDATLIPVSALANNLGMLKQDKNKKIIVYCRTGSRSVSASRILEANGFTPLNVKGGIIQLMGEKVEIVK